jgi:O-antigen ligase
MDASEGRAETALALIAIALSGLFLFEGVKLKPGVFEPIGPGAVPMGVAVLTIVLSLLVLFARWRGAPVATGPDDGQVVVPERWLLLLGVAALTLVYAALLQAGWVRYGYATVVYLLATFLLMSDRVRQDLRWAVGLALVFGLGLDYIFRYLLVADLP